MIRRTVARGLGIACVWAAALLAWPAGKASAQDWPVKGLVARWSGEGDAKDATGRYDGRPVGEIKYVKGVSGLAFKLDGGSAHVWVPNSPGLQITGNQTIALWLKPEKLGVRQNPISKAVSGEMAIVLESDGGASYYYGIKGIHTGPHQRVSLAGATKVGRWDHIAVVRDFKARKITWYVNGIMKHQAATKYDAADACTNGGKPGTLPGFLAAWRVTGVQ